MARERGRQQKQKHEGTAKLRRTKEELLLTCVANSSVRYPLWARISVIADRCYNSRLTQPPLHTDIRRGRRTWKGRSKVKSALQWN